MKRRIINLKHRNCEKTLNSIEERHGNLMNRHQYLTDKILTMEKTMPLLMAYNIWMSGGKDKKIVVNKIQDIVDELSLCSPPDSVEKIIEETKNRVGNLNIETKKLHEKIIEADIKLEESEMVLESLQVINNELNNKLEVIESYSVKKMTLPDFQLLDSSDLNCLTKLRQLIQREIRLKCCINTLEDRQNRIRSQLNCILSANEQKNQSKQTFKTDEKKFTCVCQCMIENSSETSDNDENNIKIINQKINRQIEYCECCKCDDPFLTNFT